MKETLISMGLVAALVALFALGVLINCLSGRPWTEIFSW